jgi:hypothetical protein
MLEFLRGANMIYFIRSGQYVKIGVASNPWERLAKFQTATPERLELLAIARGGYKAEQKYHRLFTDFHVRGEWFNYGPAIEEVAVVLRREYPELQERPAPEVLMRERRKYPSMDRRISAVEAVRLVVNTAVAMAENEPAIDVRSVTESRRGPGILIWIPGYVSNGETIIVASAGRDDAAAPIAPPAPAGAEEAA